eukprot:gnl/TRDRNA2_/TRDRNA2_190939_c0_seq1.p1 gnl/TRDRNA2_/TRDRNA2_190939_c0~~gnl/TRDRNA2_/TRDRNA2_190939_c0_seq1.p1  ORF type:complete len:349 (-),score=58.55 gnl/TRDRNA2_/TRDRNA2_190939_c0_seq1:66-1112(-)
MSLATSTCKLIFLCACSPWLLSKGYGLEESEADLDFLLASLGRVERAFETKKALFAAWPSRWEELYRQTARDDMLEEGALLLAEWAEGASPQKIRDALQKLSEGVRKHLPSGWRISRQLPTAEEATTAIAAVNTHLFEDFGLKGNSHDYYDPANSFLSAVLERRLGIPITLSIIWEAVARRIGLSSLLLARFPYHVLIRVPVAPASDISRDLYVDAFAGGKVMQWTELATNFNAPHLIEVLSPFVAACPASEVHARMLRNLRYIYAERGEDAQLLAVLDQAIAVGGPEAETGELLRQRQKAAQKARKENDEPEDEARKDPAPEDRDRDRDPDRDLGETRSWEHSGDEL